MAGGGSPGEPGMLEASPAAIAAVIGFFLVVTLGFEHALHAVKHNLKRRGKKGLLAATKNLVSEVMLLGLASLVLMAVTPALTKICVEQPMTFKPWIARVEPCACCLIRTKRISPCFLMKLQCNRAEMESECNDKPRIRGEIVDPDPQVCPAGSKYGYNQMGDSGKGKPTPAASPYNAYDKAPASGANSTEGSANKTEGGGYKAGSGSYNTGGGAYKPGSGANNTAGGARRRLMAPAKAATGPTCDECLKESYAECGDKPGFAPAITASMLNEVHMLLFFAAVIHIFCSLLALLFGNLKMRLLFWWSGGRGEDALAATALSAAHNMPAAGAQATNAGSPAGDLGTISIRPAEWKGRPFVLEGFGAWAKELAICTMRTILGPLYPALTKQEYSLIRAKFYYHNAWIIASALRAFDAHTDAQMQINQDVHGRDQAAGHASSSSGHKHAGHGDSHHGESHHGSGRAVFTGKESWQGIFAQYLLESMERDGAKAVGLGLPMWVLLFVFVLVSGGIGWATWIFSLIGGIFLAVLNFTLCFRARKTTRGGKVSWNKVWPIAPWVILEFVKLLLFFLSFVVGNAIFFAGFYGPNSCFFSPTGFQSRLLRGIPWYGIMAVDVFMMLCLSLLTLPLYSIIFHTSHVDQDLLREMVRRDCVWRAAKGRSAVEMSLSSEHSTHV